LPFFNALLTNQSYPLPKTKMPCHPDASHKDVRRIQLLNMLELILRDNRLRGNVDFEAAVSLPWDSRLGSRDSCGTRASVSSHGEISALSNCALRCRSVCGVLLALADRSARAGGSCRGNQFQNADAVFSERWASYLPRLQRITIFFSAWGIGWLRDDSERSRDRPAVVAEFMSQNSHGPC